MRLERLIQRHARDDAGVLFGGHLLEKAVREQPERIRSLAQFEANQFYQHGFVLLFLKASLLGSEQEVKNLYTSTFIRAYTSLRRQAERHA
jgi:hypothetical protein